MKIETEQKYLRMIQLDSNDETIGLVSDDGLFYISVIDGHIKISNNRGQLVFTTKEGSGYLENKKPLNIKEQINYEGPSGLTYDVI